MNFNSKYLETYKSLLATTELQLGYQEFIKLFRFLRIELEKDIELHSGDVVISKIKPVVLEMVTFVKNNIGNMIPSLY